jgi:hypothetical protein
MFRRIVMVAIQFNDELGFQTSKVNSIRPNRVLPPKFVPSQPSVSQGSP